MIIFVKKKLGGWLSHNLILLLKRNSYFLNLYYLVYHFFIPNGLKLLKFFSIKTLEYCDCYTEVFETTEGISVSRKDICNNYESITYSIPGIGYYYLRDVIVNPVSPCLVYNNIMYRPKNLHDELANYKNQFIVEHNLKNVIIGKRKENKIENGILLLGSWPENWYHWMVEIVPKLILLKYLPIDYRDFPLLVSNQIKKSKNHLELIKLLDVKNEIIYLDFNINYIINEGIIIDSPVLGPPRINNNLKNKTTHTVYFHKKILLNFINTLKNIGYSKKVLPKRIFLGRKKPGRSYNQNEVFRFYKKFGFENVFTEDFDVREQIELFANAELIVGPTGAHWANIIFANENCRALCWEPKLRYVRELYSNLADLSGADLRFIHYETNYDNWEKFKNNASYILDVDFLKKNSSFLFC